MSQRGFYRPQGAWVGDVIPWQEDGRFHLFYLHESRRMPKEGMPWHRVVTDDLVSFHEAGPAIDSGWAFADDFNIYTGSIVWTTTAPTTRSTRDRTPSSAAPMVFRSNW